jgi:hypothetical protein
MNKMKKEFSAISLIIILFSIGIINGLISSVKAEEDQLFINAPARVVIQQPFQVTITDPYNTGLEGVLVEFDEDSYVTDSFGRFTLIAPTVQTDTYYTIHASKESYIDDDFSVLVQLMHEVPIKAPLVISSPSSITEEESFQVTVTAKNVTISHVKVTFLETMHYTDSSGNVQLVAPEVDEDTTYTINVTKPNYYSNETTILVKDTQTEQLIYLDAPLSVGEGKLFEVVTQSVAGAYLENVQISFNDQLFFTNESGRILLNSPYINEDTDFVITANKEGYVTAVHTISILNQPDLTIETPSSITEQETFIVTITANNEPVEMVTVVFDGSSYYTDEQGKVILIAPSVGFTSSYWITATLDGYTSDLVSVTVLNQEEGKGWIYGTVTTSEGTPLKKTQICIILSSEDTQVTRTCTFTDDTGKYLLQVDPGDYDIEAKKIGYITKTIEVTISYGEGVQHDFILEQVPESSTNISEESDEITDYVFQSKISEGKVGAKITVTREAQNITSLESFSEEYDVDITLATQEKLMVTVSAEENTSGTFFVFFIEDEALLSSKFEVLYDNHSLEKMPISQFLHLEQSTEPSYVLVNTTEGNWIAIYVPSWSIHTITILSFAEPQVIQYTSYVIAAAFIIILLAASVIFKQRKED